MIARSSSAASSPALGPHRRQLPQRLHLPAAPRQSVVWPGSRCPTCDRPLAWYENIPVVSYAVLRGRCRTCGTPISVRYPIVEIDHDGRVPAALVRLGPDAAARCRGCCSRCALIVLFAIDLEHQILPNVITLPGIVDRARSSAWFLPPGLVAALAASRSAAGILWLIAEAWMRLRRRRGDGLRRRQDAGDDRRVPRPQSW